MGAGGDQRSDGLSRSVYLRLGAAKTERSNLFFFALLAMVQGTLGMCNHSNWSVIKCNGHTGFSRIWTVCRQNALHTVSIYGCTVPFETTHEQAGPERKARQVQRWGARRPWLRMKLFVPAFTPFAVLTRRAGTI